ncbi:hypothetical protein C2E23DRAFT_738450 [Lenzites betulinus]|nr:hypothetical protein C2E23DRAFT_738450 [Lenzites betulinus]
MQELLLNSYLAYKAGRSFVFANYTWNDSGSLYSIFNGNRIPSQIPYSVMIRGPIVGDPFPTGTNGSLAVSRDYFEQVCPDKVTIWRGDVQSGLSQPLNAQAITNAWLSKLARIDDPCVQSEKASGQLYDFLVFGDSKAMLEIWPELIRSPILTHFGWSSLVELAFDTNRNFFFTSRVLEPYLSSQPFTTNADRYTMIPGLMAIHVRRGDYDEHCHNLARWGSTYLAMNSFPELLDRFTPSPHTMEPADIARVQELARPHCYPSVQEIVKRVRYVRATPAAQGVNKIYIMTNADTEFLSELTIALKHDAHWDSIATTRDMVLNLEQRYVSQAVDMLVGQRAQVFIGNGFSAVTSNVVTMRLANDFRSDSIRFW